MINRRIIELTYSAYNFVLKFSNGYSIRFAMNAPVAPEKESINTSKNLSKLFQSIIGT